MNLVGSYELVRGNKLSRLWHDVNNVLNRGLLERKTNAMEIVNKIGAKGTGKAQ